MEWFDVLREFGVEVLVLVFAGYLVFWLIKRHIDNTDKIIETNTKNTETIAKNTEVLEKATETNRLLVDKIEGEITDLKSDVNTIITKLDTK